MDRHAVTGSAAGVAAARRPSLLVPGVTTLAMLAILVGLGVWQLQRRDWKTALLDRIAQSEAQPGIPLPPDPRPFTKVSAVGRMRPIVGRYGADVRDLPGGQVLGTQVVTLLDRADGPPVVTLDGWTPSDRPATVPAGAATFQGYVRPAEHPGWFSAADDPGKRQFYTLDPAVIGRALGAPSVAPFVLVLLGRDVPGVYPQPATSLPRPPNDHFQYALTWFGLAGVLVVVFLAHVRKTLRS